MNAPANITARELAIDAALYRSGLRFENAADNERAAAACQRRVTFDYDVTLTIFDGRYDREIDVAGTYSVDPLGEPGDWRIETCNRNLSRWEMWTLEDEVSKQVDDDLADMDCDDSAQEAA